MCLNDNYQCHMQRISRSIILQLLWHVKAWGARVQEYMEIIKDYGGVAKGCQSTEGWPGGQKTLNES